MNFGDLAAELIDGLVVVAKALPSDQHGLITANLAFHLRLALEALQDQKVNVIKIADRQFQIVSL